ncbi:hypothetical protein J1N35_000879 [Gossypium stocksii]|uniref:Aminotransferase-like plant mobile domain-containing protein n=1 Tax=Gossypium stocksii TaxID=47602 RepID=A0A9D3WJ62_9ROSI|nr:hypothetical protein J1N35_000879 [Gossypium stocksii]
MPMKEVAPIAPREKAILDHTILIGDIGLYYWLKRAIKVLYRALRDPVNGLGYSLDERLMPYLELAGFGLAALIRMFDLWYNLISALVKCWCPETHTFHLPCGECTVTLEDVALQLGLPIDRSVVTSVSTIAEPIAFCYSLLRVSPNDAESKFTGLRFSWLKANFEHLSINATEHEVMCVPQAYIMHIIGGVLMLDANNNRAYLIHGLFIGCHSWHRLGTKHTYFH